MQNKKKKKESANDKFLFHPSDSTGSQLTKNNYSIVERSGKVKEIKGITTLLNSPLGY